MITLTLVKIRTKICVNFCYPQEVAFTGVRRTVALKMVPKFLAKDALWSHFCSIAGSYLPTLFQYDSVKSF